MKISIEYQILAGVIVALAAYLMGNISNAILISRLKGKDIRQCGSGNPGTMNMLRVYGKALGVLTLALDVLKGTLPCILGWLFMGDGQFLQLGTDRIGMYVAGLFVVIGHVYPVFLKFKGGKGAATVIGACLAMQPLYTLLFFVIGVAFLILTTIGSLTSFIMIGAPLAIEGLAAANNPMGIYASSVLFLMYLLVLYAHRKNLFGLFAGTEGRVKLFGYQKRDKAVDRSAVLEEYLIVE